MLCKKSNCWLCLSSLVFGGSLARSPSLAALMKRRRRSLCRCSISSTVAAQFNSLRLSSWRERLSRLQCDAEERQQQQQQAREKRARVDDAPLDRSSLRDGREIEGHLSGNSHLSISSTPLQNSKTHLLGPGREVLEREEGLLRVDGGLDLVGDPHGCEKRERERFFFRLFRKGTEEGESETRKPFLSFFFLTSPCLSSSFSLIVRGTARLSSSLQYK